MAKNVKYRVLFGSDTNKERKIDIYAEYSGSAIELTAGESPFVTSEANSENIETNLRPSTGTMQICTKVPAASVAAMGKSMLTIEDMLPEDNADRPVVLSEKVNGSWVTKWQGFVSCEVYDQDYTANPQNLEIPIISMIEALDSIKLKYEDIEWYITIKTAIRMALAKVTHAAGISLFDRVYFPNVNYQILNKYIDPSILIEMSLHDNENKVDYVENGNSFKTIVENVCKLMGWIVREEGRNIYFVPTNHNTGDSVTMVYQSYANFHSVDTFAPEGTESVSTINMSALTYRGIGHKKSIYQGKTFVEIIANIKQYEEYLSMPDFPRGEFIQATNDSNMYVCNNYEYSRFSSHRCLLMNWSMVQDQVQASGLKVNIDKLASFDMAQTYLQHIEHFTHTDLYNNFYPLFVVHTHIYTDFQYYAMSFFARWKGFGSWDGDTYTPGSDIAGLVLYGIPDRHMFVKGSSSTIPQIPPFYIPTFKTNDDESVYIYKQSTPNVFFANTGKLRLKMTCGYYDFLAWYFFPRYGNPDPYEVSIKGREVNLTDSLNQDYLMIAVAVKWADKWYDGNGNWTTEFNRFWAKFEDNQCDMELDINSSITGRVDIYISPYMRGTYSRTGYNESTHLDYEAYYPVDTMILTDMSLVYEPENAETLNDNSTNNYFRLLDTKFHDGLSVHTDIASYNLNRKSPSIIVDSYTESETNFMSFLQYNLTSGTEQRRPEIDLLDRLCKWYGKIRRKIELEILHPENTIFPMTKIQADADKGYDGKLYLPIAEQRDWKTDVSTITCLEDSDGDE